MPDTRTAEGIDIHPSYTTVICPLVFYRDLINVALENNPGVSTDKLDALESHLVTRVCKLIVSCGGPRILLSKEIDRCVTASLASCKLMLNRGTVSTVNNAAKIDSLSY